MPRRYPLSYTIASDAVGAVKVVTMRHRGMARSMGAVYSTLTTRPGPLTDPPEITRSFGKTAALKAHADALTALVTDQEVE